MPVPRMWATRSAWSTTRGAIRSEALHPARPMFSASTPRRGFRSTAQNDLVIGNLFGTNANGANVGNVVGVLDNVGGNTIGGTSAGAANVFGFNTSAGLQIDGPSELVIGNLFGTSTSGANVGNAVGVQLEAGGNTIGGTSSGAANVFGFNSTSGLQTSKRASRSTSC